MAFGETRRFVQRGTGQIAILYFDDDGTAWVIDMFRKPGSSSARMGSWPSLSDALVALERMQFEEDTEGEDTPGLGAV